MTTDELNMRTLQSAGVWYFEVSEDEDTPIGYYQHTYGFIETTSTLKATRTIAIMGASYTDTYNKLCALVAKWNEQYRPLPIMNQIDLGRLNFYYYPIF